MNIEKNLQMLVKEQEAYDNNRSVSFYQNTYHKFAEFYIDKLLISPSKNTNAEKLLNHIDVILKYTGAYSQDWITYQSMYNQKDFLDKLSQNLGHFQFPNYIYEIFNNLCHTISNDEKSQIKTQDVFNPKMLNALLDLKANSTTYSKIYTFMNKSQKKDFLSLMANKNTPIDLSSFSLDDEEINLIKQNILKFAELTPNLFSLREKIFKKDEYSSEIEILNKYIDKNPSRFIDGILNKTFFGHTSSKYKNLQELVLLIIQDICKNEKKEISATQYIKAGSYSAAFSIGDKVIKIGKKRNTEKFPNNPYIVAPLLRKKIDIDNQVFYIEVVEKVDTSNKDITEEDMYNLYKNVRDLGLMWNDVAIRNVGRLLKDNIIHWQGNLSPSDKALELDNKRGTIILNKGDLVILDADFIYDENEENKSYASNSLPLQRKFEKRYQEEIKTKELVEVLDAEDQNSAKEDKNFLK